MQMQWLYIACIIHNKYLVKPTISVILYKVNNIYVVSEVKD